jgi:prepilin-type N-terminal cleavage/methylation domain-containing protein
MPPQNSLACARGLRQRTARRSAFTLVELMIVVAIIGLLAAMTIGSMVKARKQSQGNRILNDVSQLDDAITQWAIDANKKDGDAIDWTAIPTYLKKPLVMSDILGHPYSWSTVGSNQIGLSWNTKVALTGVGIDWGPY